MDLNTDFSYMTDEELDELISRIKEAKERRSESRKADLWNNVRRAVNNYIMDFGMIELFTEDHSFMLDADSFSIPAKSILWIKIKKTTQFWVVFFCLFCPLTIPKLCDIIGRRVVGHHAPSLHKSIITQIFRCIFVQIASLTFSRNGGTMSTTKEKR